MINQKTPIGYWVRKVDEQLTKGIDEIQASFGLNRTSWQVLNLINEVGKISINILKEDMRLFAGAERVEIIIADFRMKNLLAGHDEEISLSQKGNELYAACLEEQKVFRQKAMNGITEQQYQETVKTLQKITQNLGVE